MSGNPALGQFLATGDVNQAAVLAAYALQNLTEHDMLIIKNVLESNWDDEEQMVSNLLQNPFLISEDIRKDSLIRGLKDTEVPYYILSAALGVQKLQVDGTENNDLQGCLREAVFYEQGAVSMRAFITLHAYLRYPDDKGLFLDILKTKKSPLHDSALSWLVLQVNDKLELTKTLKEADVPGDLISEAEKKIDLHCESLAHGEESPVAIEVFSYIPNLIDFNAMLDKEDSLIEFFEDLDTDGDEKITADEVKTFLEDIGNEVSMEEIIKEMRNVGVDDAGKIDKDGFIEMMFPKFQCA